jgi:hypothetical protein
MASDLMQQSAKLAKRLAAIPGEILVHVRRALVQAADDLAGLARTLAPEDAGDLKALITVTPPGGSTPLMPRGGGKRAAADNQTLMTAGNP